MSIIKTNNSYVCTPHTYPHPPPPTHTSGVVTRKTNAKIAIYSCPFDSMATETKGTVLLKTASDLMEFSKGEEELVERQVKMLSDDGFNVVVAGGKVGEMALHFLNKYNILCLR